MVKGLGEGDRASAFFRRMIVPLIAPDCDAVVTVQPLLMAGGKQLLSTLPQKLHQVHRGGKPFLLLGEMDVGNDCSPQKKKSRGLMPTARCCFSPPAGSAAGGHIFRSDTSCTSPAELQREL